MNLSGRQRMLTQRMTKEVLWVSVGIEEDSNRESLGKTTRMFAETLVALRDGDVSVGLPATDNDRIVRQLDKVQGMFDELDPLLTSVQSGGTLTAEQLVMLAEQNVPLLQEMNKAVKMYERQANKTLNTESKSAVVINLAGKQRMLTQKLTKECLLFQLGLNPEVNRLNLLEASSLFARTLAGLLDGDQDLDLPPTQDAEILAQLDRVKTVWNQMKPLVDSIITHERRLTPSQLRVLASTNLTLLAEANAVVKLYEEQANSDQTN